MAFDLELPGSLSSQGWKVKIRDRERSEPPHVTIIRKRDSWRVDLRSLRFLDKEPPPRMVPSDLLKVVMENIEPLRAAWDEMYPENRVGDVGQ